MVVALAVSVVAAVVGGFVTVSDMAEDSFLVELTVSVVVVTVLRSFLC